MPLHNKPLNFAPSRPDMQAETLLQIGLAAQRYSIRLLNAEFMYKPRPLAPRPRRVFDYALHSRLHALSQTPDAAVVYICNDDHTLASLRHLPSLFPKVRHLFTITRPALADKTITPADSRTPFECLWETPDQWQPVTMTDRWARIDAALTVASQLPNAGYLIMPAHDAIWGETLLADLIDLSAAHAVRGLPAAVSPYTPRQHSPVPGAAIPRIMIDLINIAFGRDDQIADHIRAGAYQSFWGKMGMIPFALCDEIRIHADHRIWEDDLEIDRVLRARGLGVVSTWIDQPTRYRQALPVFDRAGVRAVFDRTLHYALNIPAATPGEHSFLKRPLSEALQARRQNDRRFARALTLSEQLIDDCLDDLRLRIARYERSWVDWGNYRYVVRVGDPFIQVWYKH